MSSTSNTQIRLASRPTGWVTAENFKATEEPVPEPGDGQVLVRNIFLSVDPYMRGRMNDVKSYVPPFQIGDVIQVGGTTGEVLSVDVLSVKLRTFDNIFVRLPNESLIKSEVRTLSRFPIRRADIQVGIDYASDLAEVRAALLEVADRNPLCLDEPAPLIIFQGFADSSMNLQFSVWATRESYLELKTGFQEVAGSKHALLAKWHLMGEPAAVADYGYRSMMKGKTVAVPGFLSNLMLVLERLIPNRRQAYLVGKLQRMNQT